MADLQDPCSLPRSESINFLTPCTPWQSQLVWVVLESSFAKSPRDLPEDPAKMASRRGVTHFQEMVSPFSLESYKSLCNSKYFISQASLNVSTDQNLGRYHLIANPLHTQNVKSSPWW